MNPLKPGRVSAATTPGKRATRSRVWVDVGAVVVISSLLLCRGSFDLGKTAGVHQIRSKNGHGHIVGVRFFTIVPAVLPQVLLVDLFLKFNETGDQRLRGWRTTGDVNVDRNEFVDACYDVVSLLEGSA